jgi:phosphoadenosine phosphosulfate reductase
MHTTRPLEAGMTEEETRFFGLKRECGLHDPHAWAPEL